MVHPTKGSINNKWFTPEDERFKWWYDRILGVPGLWSCPTE